MSAESCPHPMRDGRDDGAWVCVECGDVQTAEQQFAETICGSVWDAEFGWVHYRGGAHPERPS